MNQFGDDKARRFVCRNCRAVWITDFRSAAENCAYCQSPVFLGERLDGERAPDTVIPFAVSKRKAKKAYRKWKTSLRFAPKDYVSQAKEQTVKKAYVPVWLYNVSCTGTATLRCTKEEKQGKKKEKNRVPEDILVTDKPVNFTLHHFPGNASTLLPDKLITKLMPVPAAAAKSFSPDVLRTTFAEKGNTDSEAVFSRLTKDSITPRMDKVATADTEDYDIVEILDRDYRAEVTKKEYVLLPVWIACLDLHDEDYIFALNGQTGKPAGRPPCSRIKVLTAFALLAVFFFFLCRLVTVFLGGPLL